MVILIRMTTLMTRALLWLVMALKGLGWAMLAGAAGVVGFDIYASVQSGAAGSATATYLTSTWPALISNLGAGAAPLVEMIWLILFSAGIAFALVFLGLEKAGAFLLELLDDKLDELTAPPLPPIRAPLRTAGVQFQPEARVDGALLVSERR